MSSFAWQGTFRKGQWRTLRSFILNERRDISKREAVILAEMKKIGRVRIVYRVDPNTNKATENRIALGVDPPGCSLEKLMSAYVMLGGNPYDISMFLSPDDAIPYNATDALVSQPGNGVMTAGGMTYNYGTTNTASDGNLIKYKPSRSGGVTTNPEAPIGILIEKSCRWVSKEIQFKRNALEARIIKLCDLREQLSQELTDLVWASVGEGTTDVYVETNYDKAMSVAGLVRTIDGIFNVPQEDGSVPSDGDANQEQLAIYPNLILDEESESNNAL